MNRDSFRSNQPGRGRLAALALAAMLQAAPVTTARVLAQPATVQPEALAMADILKGAQFPLTIKAADLTPEWRQVVVVGQEPDSPAAYANAELQELMRQRQAYYTLGTTVSSGGETFLVVYRHTPPVGPRPGMIYTEDGPPRDMDVDFQLNSRMQPATSLNLSLLNLRAAGSIHDIRAFDPARDILSPAEEQRIRTRHANKSSASNLKQLALATMMYMRDYDEKLPLMLSANSMAQIMSPVKGRARPAVQQVLLPYLQKAEYFVHPATRAIYRPNTALSHRALAEFDDPSKVILFHEPRPAPDNTRAIVFLSGRVARIAENEWEQVQTTSAMWSRRPRAHTAPKPAGSPPQPKPQPAKPKRPSAQPKGQR